MNKKDYEMQLNVYDMQYRGDELPKKYKNWKIKYNKQRTENVYSEGDIKVTRYKPVWTKWYNGVTTKEHYNSLYTTKVHNILYSVDYFFFDCVLCVVCSVYGVCHCVA